jgi:N-acetylneuraminic acid mutarotase
MIVWGGYDGAQSTWLGTGGRYDPPADTWLPTAQGASAPEGRSGHTAVWTGLEMIVWGGQTNAYDIMNTGGRYDPAIDSWVPTASALRSTGSGDRPTAVWTGTEMIVWGGLARDGVGEGDRYRPSTDAWLPVSTGPNAPLERQTHTAVWTGEEMIVWGGWQQSGFGLDGGGRYDPSTDTWAAVSTGPGTPAGRGQHTAVWTGTEMIVWGGETEFDYVNEVFVVTNTGGRYDPSSDSWSPTSTSASVPEARFQHAAVWTGTEMVVWGGSFVREPGQGRLLHSGGRYDPAGDSWNATSENGSTPEGRTGHTALWTGTEMIVWGGDGSELGAPRLFDDGARYDPSTDSWLSVPADPSQPGGRAFHTALWTGDEMLVWGGYGDFNSVDSGSRYAPTTDQWNPTSTLPPPRIGHAAVWTGSGMIVAGGYPPDPYTYFYCVCSDADRDDVCAGEDPFPESDSRATVVIGECDSGVPNEFVSPGANMNDLIAQCRADAPVPGEFVSCVALLTNAWKTDGRITGRAKSRMQRCVGPS